jgi:TonB-linked SusC/RagA family outer membrane protein
LFAIALVASISVTGYAQTRQVSGTVTDENGQALLGVAVSVNERSTVAAVSDLQGRFTISAAPNETLTFNYIGYAPKEVTVGSQTQIDVTMESSSLEIDQVVVVGYGVQRRGDVTSSVASVKPENFNTGAVKDIGQLIQGKVAGLTISNPSGNPTDGTQIRLRGTNTIGGATTAPLVLIDGIPGSLSTVAPEDVEAVDVLKDGSAAAIYGTRGTNGVIMITTRQNRGAQINNVEYTTYVSTSQIARQLDVLSASEFADLYPTNDHGASTDWYDQILRTPVTHTHNLTFQGGTSQTNYIANVNYSGRQGIILDSDSELFRGRIEINHRMFNDKLRIKFGILGSQSKSPLLDFNGAYQQATLYNPTDPVWDPELPGRYFENVNKFEYQNPVAMLKEHFGDSKQTNMRYNGTITWNPIAGLTFTALGSYGRNTRLNGESDTIYHITALRDGRTAWSRVTSRTDMEKMLELTAQYTKTIGQHNFTVLGGYAYNETDREEASFTNWNFQDGYFGSWHNIGVGEALKEGIAEASSSKVDTNLVGFFGRATYSYKNRYLFMGSLRYEGASQLWGTDNIWGLFPSISLGWRITEEAFMRNQNVFDDLKLRVGYGVTGSQPNDRFLGVAMMGYGQYQFINGQWIRTFQPSSNPNPDLKWEEKHETNIGLDFTMLNERLSGSIDVYNREVVGLLYRYDVPVPPNLFNRTMANGGNMRNRGIEILLSGTPVKNDKFTWTSTATFSVNENKLMSLSGSGFATAQDWYNTGTVYYDGQNTYSHRVQVGQPIGNFHGFRVVDATEDGKWIYENAKGDLVKYDDFKHSADDKLVIGNGLPKATASWNNSFQYKNIDLNITMRGAFGYQIINGARMDYEGTRNARAENRLTSVNRLVFGRAKLSQAVAPQYNSYYVEDGDYWKIDNITLGYNFKLNSNVIKGLRLYASVLNAFTITGYEGVDPEVSIDGLTPGLDNRGQFPHTRTWTFGVNVKF